MNSKLEPQLNGSSFLLGINSRVYDNGWLKVFKNAKKSPQNYNFYHYFLEKFESSVCSFML